MKNPFDNLLQDCLDGKYSNAQLKSMSAAFESFYPWYRGSFIGKTGKQVNPDILVSTSLPRTYLLLANLLVFLKRYYLPKAPSMVLHRVHSTSDNVFRGDTIQFKSLGKLSSWTLREKPRVIGRALLFDHSDLILKAKMPSENIMWTPSTSGVLALANYTKFEGHNKQLDALIAAMSAAVHDTLVFKEEQEVIVMCNKPVYALVLSVKGSPYASR